MMNVKAKLAELERRVGESKTVDILVVAGDTDRARLAAVRPGQRLYVVADPSDADLVDQAQERGVRVTVRYVGGNVLEAV